MSGPLVVDGRSAIASIIAGAHRAVADLQAARGADPLTGDLDPEVFAGEAEPVYEALTATQTEPTTEEVPT